MFKKAFRFDDNTVFYFDKKDKKHVDFHNKRLYPHLLMIEFSYSERSPDVIWGQLKRSLNAVSKQLNLAGFKVIRNTCTTDEKKLAAWYSTIAHIGTHNAYHVGQILYIRKMKGWWDENNGVK